LDYDRIVERATRTFQLKQELGACLNELSERDGFWLTPEGRGALTTPKGEESRIPTLESYLSDLKGKGTQSKFFKKSLWQRGRPESLRPIKDSERV